MGPRRTRFENRPLALWADDHGEVVQVAHGGFSPVRLTRQIAGTYKGMKTPAARGPLSTWVLHVLHGGHTEMPPIPGDVLTDEDAQLALWMLYELHYRGFDDVEADAEWNLELLPLRRQLEARFEVELRQATSGPTPTGDVGQALLDLADSAEGPSVARFLQREATAEQLRDYLRERSLQQLKESDPHSFVLGRLDGGPKVALAELQYDEYGGGQPNRMHALLYANAMSAAGLDPTYGAYIDTVSATTLASANVMSLFAMNRRLRAASMGHLAIFEATSSLPCRRIAIGLSRLGFPAEVAAYFQEHVEADAVHEQVVARDICAPLVDDDPGLREDVFFGARACLFMDTLIAEDFLGRWQLKAAS